MAPSATTSANGKPLSGAEKRRMAAEEAERGPPPTPFDTAKRMAREILTWGGCFVCCEFVISELCVWKLSVCVCVLIKNCCLVGKEKIYIYNSEQTERLVNYTNWWCASPVSIAFCIPSKYIHHLERLSSVTNNQTNTQTALPTKPHKQNVRRRSVPPEPRPWGRGRPRIAPAQIFPPNHGGGGEGARVCADLDCVCDSCVYVAVNFQF